MCERLTENEHFAAKVTLRPTRTNQADNGNKPKSQ